MSRTLAYLVFCFSLVTGAAFAQDDAEVSAARLAYLAGDYDAALAVLRPKAEAGNLRAINIMGAAYDGGHGVEQNFDTAVESYTRASEQDYPRAVYNLGLIHNSDDHPERRDFVKAADYYDQAIALGHTLSWVNRGIMHELGQGGPVDMDSAAQAYQNATDAGEALGMNNLATFYRNGFGVPQDITGALELYEQAIEGGEVEALYSLGKWYADGDNGLAIDYAKSVSYLDVAVENGHLDATVLRGYMHEVGEGGPVDFGAAADHYARAADLGSGFAMNSLANLYRFGNGVEADTATAVDWFERSIAAGNGSALYDLGLWYTEGSDGLEVDFDKGFALLDRAIEQGDDAAMVARGYMHDVGEGGPIDKQAAYGLYEMAIELGNSYAMHNLALALSDNEDDDDDLGRAVTLYRMAAEAGDAGAFSELGYMYENGHGVTPDQIVAMALYRMAAEEGSSRGAVNFGVELVETETQWQDYIKGYGWCVLGLSRADAGDVEEFTQDCEELAQTVGPEAVSAGQTWAATR